MVAMDATDIIEALGGDAHLAKQLGVGRTTVFTWHQTGIPQARAIELRRLALERRLQLEAITLEVLLESKPRQTTVNPASPAAAQKGTRG